MVKLLICWTDLWEMYYLLLIGDKHLAGFLDHRLGFQLLLRETVPPRIESLLARHAGQCQVCWVRVKVHQDVATAVSACCRPRRASRRR